MKFTSILIILGILTAVIFYQAKPSTVSVSTATINAQPGQPNSEAVDQSSSIVTVQTPKQESSIDDDSIESTAKIDSVSSLTPEMKQAVNDKLLHNAPLDIQKDANGRTRLNHNGRFTSVPVAIKQPDGSIKIKEYSHIPKSE